MATHFFHYDPDTLSFVEVRVKPVKLYVQLAFVAVGAFVFASLATLALDYFVQSPLEMALKSELARYQIATDSLISELQRVRRDSIPDMMEPSFDDTSVLSSDRLARIESKISTLERFLIALIVGIVLLFFGIILNKPRYVFLPPPPQSSSNTS